MKNLEIINICNMFIMHFINFFLFIFKNIFIKNTIFNKILKMKYAIVFSLFLMSFFNVFAQQAERISVAIPGFRTSNSGIKSETISAIHQRVIDAFVSNSKFSVVERNQLQELQSEVELQKTEAFMEGSGNVSDKVKNSGANFLVTGVISRVQFSKEQREKKEWDAAQKKSVVTGYYDVFFCTIELNIKLIDVTTSQIVISEIVSVKNGGSGDGGGLLGSLLSAGSGSAGARTNEEAYNQTLDEVSQSVTSLIRKTFPNVLSIAEVVTKDKKGFAEEVLLVGDFTDGMGKKQELYVKLVTESMIGGKKLTRRKVIGTVKILKVEEGGFISAKIRTGEEEITKAIEQKANIQITENQ
jgi:curli biogenesis system outer membrane secretion channel CsgG